MNRTFKATVAALMLAVSFAGSVAAGPFEDAAAAYKKGDYATALDLAVASRNKNAMKALDIVAAQLTPTQIAEAQKLAHEWKPK
jgi:hypothetical protein